MTSRQVTKMMIKRAGKLVYTKPETVIQDIALELSREMNFLVEQNIPMRIWSGAENFVFQIDHFLHSPDFPKQICLHTDGKYHETTKIERKDRWKDELIVANNMRSIHASARDTTTKTLQAYLKEELRKAILSSEPIIYIAP